MNESLVESLTSASASNTWQSVSLLPGGGTPLALASLA